MDSKSLSRGTTVVLAAYLPYVWHGNLAETKDKPMHQAAAELWRVLRPALEKDESKGGIATLNASLEHPTADNLIQMAELLIGLFDANSWVKEQVEVILGSGPLTAAVWDMDRWKSPEDLVAQYEKLRNLIAAKGSRPVEEVVRIDGHPAGGVATASRSVQACQICGRQDSSLRVVVYPFVVSLLLVTFRRAFAGIWCWRHATFMRALASLITAGIGWLGFPFGLMFTPMVLFKLARGGDQPPDINQQMLVDLADHKLKHDNDPGEAIHCLEAALAFGKSDTVESKLRELNTLYPEAAGTRQWPQMGAFLAVLVLAGLIGLSVGVLEYLVDVAFTALGTSEVGLLAVLSWAPWAAMLFTAGIVVSQLVQLALWKTRTRQRLLGVVLAIFAALMTIYMSLSGYMAAYYAIGQPLETFRTVMGAVYSLSRTVVWGGIDRIYGYIANGAGNIIYKLVLLAMTYFNLMSTIAAAQKATNVLHLADDLQARSTNRVTPVIVAGWLGMLAFTVICIGLLGATFVMSIVYRYGHPTTMKLVSDGMSLLDQGDIEGARAVFEEAKAFEPDSFAPYLGLSAVERISGNCEKSLEAIQIAQPLAPELGQSVIYAYKAGSYNCMDQVDNAISALEKSVELAPSSKETLTQLGMMYYATGDFEKATETLLRARDADTNWAASHALLALVYFVTDQPEKEQAAIEQSLAQTLDDQYEYVALSGYYFEKKDFQQAEKYAREALALRPDDPQTILAVARILAQKGESNKAMILADRVPEIPYFQSEMHQVRSTAYVMQEDLDSALVELQKADTLRPQDTWIHSSKGRIYVFRRAYQAAVDEALLSLEINKYNVLAYQVLGLAYQGLGRHEDAEAAAERAIELEPKGDIPHYVLGVYFMDTGNKTGAIAELEKFIALTWDRAYVRDLIVDAKNRLSDLGVR